ncbi:MAG: hypothetical protein KDJ47_12795 [Hyphomicrobiaceae bacterium]|nr:hypothetical protein [Hyphomicrobiaceae bacterium]
MDKVHSAAADHLPAFITAPGNTDVLMVVSAIVLIATVLGAGVFFLWLHSLPERMVHNRLQYDLVAVLALLSLFTHVHAFWIAALLLAFVTIPDMSRHNPLGPLRSIAKSLRSLVAQNEEGKQSEPLVVAQPPATEPAARAAAPQQPATKEA